MSPSQQIVLSLTGLSDLLSLTGVLALLLSLGAAFFMARDGFARGFYFTLLALHLCASFAFYIISFYGPADANAYYTESEWIREFGVGTDFIKFTLGWIREFTGLTFLDAFLVFQLFGFMGIVLLHRAAVRLAEDGFAVRVAILSAVLLMPGLHFWTSSIGKDGLAMLAYGIIATGLARERPSIALTVAGVALYFLVRPHIGIFLTGAMALAFLPLFGRAQERTQWMGLCAGIGTVLLVPFVFRFAGVGGESFTDLITYLEGRQSYDFRGGSDYNAAEMNPFERLGMFLFRPLFFDADEAFGFIASIENLILIAIFGYLCRNLGMLQRLCRASPALRFHAIFLLGFLAVFSQVNTNLGIALRYKVMILPALFLLLTAVAACHNRLKRDRREALAARLHGENRGGAE